MGLTSALLAAAALVLASSWLVGSILIAPANHAVPRPSGFDASLVSIPGPGHPIAGWWANSGRNLPVVLLLPAVRADRSTMVSRAQLLREHGFSTLLIDLQGQGETPGTAITFGLRESADVVAALGWIKKEAPGRRVGVLGCSQGGAAALLAPQPLGVDAVVLEQVYPRISPAIENRLRLRVGPLAPILTHLFLAQLKARLHITASELEPIRSVGNLGSPVLIAAGSQDQHTTLAESQQLFDAASSPKELWTVTGAKHQDLLSYDKAQYESHVVRFLVDTLRTAPQFDTHRLSKVEVEQLIGDSLKSETPLVFGPNQGVSHCCDLGEPYLEFGSQHTLLIYGDGFVRWQVPISYDVAADGKIILKFPAQENEIDFRKAKDLHDAYAFRYGPDLYLVKDSDPTPDLGFEDGARWPYKMLPTYKTNLFQGDWDLNIAKSTFQPMPPMKKYTMKVIDAGAGHLLIKSDWIDSDGTPGHVEYTTAFDGKPIPIIDYPLADTVTDTIINATTWKSVWTKSGKIVETELEMISADGKTFREIDQGSDANGKKFKNRLLFERP